MKIIQLNGNAVFSCRQRPSGLFIKSAVFYIPKQRVCPLLSQPLLQIAPFARSHDSRVEKTHRTRQMMAHIHKRCNMESKYQKKKKRGRLPFK